MTTQRKHRHHLIPRHMGGSDEEDNLTPPISIEVHAAFHYQLWQDFGKKEDLIAWKCLSGRITSEEARLEAAKAGQDRSELYKETRRGLGERLQKFATAESCSRGGKESSKSLVQWQKDNELVFKARCAALGKENTKKLQIPHTYQGVHYQSKKALQKEHKMCNNKFYKLLAAGEILREGWDG